MDCREEEDSFGLQVSYVTQMVLKYILIIYTHIFLFTVILFNKQFHELIPMELNLNAPKLNKYKET